MGNSIQVVGNQIYTVHSLAEYLECSERWVYEKLRKANKAPEQYDFIPFFKIGRDYRFSGKNVEEYISSQSSYLSSS